MADRKYTLVELHVDGTELGERLGGLIGGSSNGNDEKHEIEVEGGEESAEASAAARERDDRDEGSETSGGRSVGRRLVGAATLAGLGAVARRRMRSGSTGEQDVEVTDGESAETVRVETGDRPAAPSIRDRGRPLLGLATLVVVAAAIKRLRGGSDEGEREREREEETVRTETATDVDRRVDPGVETAGSGDAASEERTPDSESGSD
ncbi:hypothetical protein BRC83_06020 [Halobacteriales archaeon QS_1_68_17]|nr:MAG: hypothetical protein BRC83_06020 [Halobacteriales archaeon QS_1_68_17]